MSVHANIHNVEKWSVEEIKRYGGSMDCQRIFYSRTIIIHADGVRHEFSLMADTRDVLDLAPSGCCRGLAPIEECPCTTAARQKADSRETA